MPYINWSNVDGCCISSLVSHEQLVRELCSLRFININEFSEVNDALSRLNNLPTYCIDIHHRAPTEVVVNIACGKNAEHLKEILCAISWKACNWSLVDKGHLNYIEVLQNFLNNITIKKNTDVFDRTFFEDHYCLQWIDDADADSLKLPDKPKSTK